MAEFDAVAAATLSGLGVELGPGDLDVLRFVDAAFRPQVAALDAVDLRELQAEPALDPSHAP